MIRQIATIRVARDQFAEFRPWKWWIEGPDVILCWGGDEWTKSEAEAAAIEWVANRYNA